MSIKAPSTSLAAPNYAKLKTGVCLHRVHQTKFSGDEFNLCLGGQTRFAPIVDASFKCVPSMYAGSTVSSAIFETIFHDVPANAKFKTVRKKEIDIRSHSELEVLRDLNMVNLRAADLKKWGIKRENLVGTSAKLYQQTAKWAEAIHFQFTGADGLMWTSNQFDPDTAYLFFGDRVPPSAFSIMTTQDGKTDKNFLSDVHRAGKLADITITI